MTCSSHLVNELRAARGELLAVCRDAPDDALRHRPPSTHPEPVEGWAALEVLAHIADVDRYYLSQARAIRDDPGHAFVYFDDEAWKRDNADAIDRDPHSVRLALAFAHEEVVRWAGALTPEELDRAGGHPRRDSITVRAMLERIANHDRNHAEQVRSALSGWGGASTLDP